MLLINNLRHKLRKRISVFLLHFTLDNIVIQFVTYIVQGLEQQGKHFQYYVNFIILYMIIFYTLL